MLSNSPKLKAVATAILGLCLLAFVIIDEPSYQTQYLGGRRMLQEEQQVAAEQGNVTVVDVYSQAQTYLIPLSTPPDPKMDKALFWHIEKSGGTTAKEYFKCSGKYMDKASGAVSSKDFRSRTDPFGQRLINKERKGRMLALFRHPIDRLVSKFYYLRHAYWEHTYHPEWKEMGLLEWAKSYHTDDNHHVKTLVGKSATDSATEEDLEIAKRTIESYFVVGLTDEFEESMRRFKVVLGIDDSRTWGWDVWCKEGYFQPTPLATKKRIMKRNSAPHPRVEEDDPAYQLLAENNSLDMQLYEFIEDLFERQKEVIESFESKSDDDANARNLVDLVASMP